MKRDKDWPSYYAHQASDEKASSMHSNNSKNSSSSYRNQPNPYSSETIHPSSSNNSLSPSNSTLHFNLLRRRLSSQYMTKNESLQYEHDESEVWWHHQLQR